MNDSTDKLLSERSKTHGDYTKTARVIQGIKRVIHNELEGTLRDFQQEALDMIANKIGRIVSGDPNFKEHWDDIAGYARLVSDRLSPERAKAPEDDWEARSARHNPKKGPRRVGLADITDVD